MLYAAFTDPHGQEHSKTFWGWEPFHKATFNPETELHCLIDFTVSGRSYGERKESVRRIAQTFQHENRPGLTYWDITSILSWFKVMGRRYGLLREFQENGIL